MCMCTLVLQAYNHFDPGHHHNIGPWTTIANEKLPKYQSTQCSQRAVCSYLHPWVVDARSWCSPRNLTNTAWSLAVLGFRNKQLMEKVVAEVSKIVTELIPQEVANLAWCCGKIGFVDVVFLEAIARQSISIIHEFVTQDVCTVGRCPITIIKYVYIYIYI